MVAQGVRRVSPEVVAALLGVTVGVVVERLARSLGRLRFEASVRSALLTAEVEEESNYPRTATVRLEEANEATVAGGGRYTFEIDLFNSSEVPTGLRNVRVEITAGDGPAIESRPHDIVGTDPLAPDPIISPPPVDVINLPPRQFTHLELREDYLSKDAAEVLKGGRWKIEFVAERPGRPFFGILGSKTYRKTITDAKAIHRIS
jgi:hypothetical protein